jgi:P4 family phage/plasmid primase-like protien
MVLTDEQLHDLDLTYNTLFWNIIQGRYENGDLDKKRPDVLNYRDYFDSKQTVPYEALLEHMKQENKLLMVILGKQRDGKYTLACWDIDTKDENVRRLFLHYFPSSLWQETKDGYHFFYGIAGNPDEVRRYFESKDLIGKQYNITDDIEVEVYTANHGIAFIGKSYGKLQGKLEFLQKEDFYDASIAYVHALYLYAYLKDYYKPDHRDKIVFRLSGILAKKRIPKHIGISIIDGLASIFNDEERRSRLKVTEDSYKDYADGKPLNTRLEEVIPKDVAKKIYEYFDFRPNGNGNSKDRERERERRKPKEFLILNTPSYKEAYVMLELAEKYAKGSPYIQALYMLHFYKDGEDEDDDKDARFLANYRFVYDKDRPEQGYWIEWNGYCWKEADVKVLKLKVDTFFRNKVNAVNEMYNEIIEAVRSVGNVNNSNNNNNDDGNNDDDDNDDDNSSKELVSKHKEVIDNLNRLYAGVDVDDEDDNVNNSNSNKINTFVKWLEKEKEQVTSLLMYAIKSERSTNELLDVITKMSEYYENGFLISKEMLDPEVGSSENNYNGLYINTKTHLLVWNAEKKDFTAIPHGEETKRYYITKYVDVEYIPEATCPKFVDFLKEISLGNMELAKFLALIGSLTLTRRLEEIAFIFTGGGYNGKSTLVQVFLGILGYNGYEGKEEVLNEIQNDLTPHLYNCIGKTLIVIDDPRIKVINLQNLKSLVSTGNISIRTLYHRPIEIRKDFNIIICINGEPKFNEQTEGMYRRICIVGFDYKIPKEKAILDYHRILLDKEKHGIFNLLLTALKEYLSNVNKKKVMDYAPDVVKARTERSIWEQDHAREFYDRFLEYVPDPSVYMPISKIYEKYLGFCDKKKIPAEFRLSKQELSKVLTQYGIASRLVNKVTVKICVKFREPPRTDDLEEDDGVGGGNEGKENKKKKEGDGDDNNNNNSNSSNSNGSSNNSSNNTTTTTTTAFAKTDAVNNSPTATNDDGDDEGHDFHWFVIVEDCKKHVGNQSYYKCPISECYYCTDKGSRLKKHLVEEHNISLDRILDRKVA